jgi:hypothetical protein
MPVVLNSAYERYKDDCRSIAADYYVVKSADLTELKTRIRQSQECGRQYKIHFDAMLAEEEPQKQTRHSVRS